MDDVNMKIEDVSGDVTTLLLEWDCAELIHKFRENDVDLETLRLMKPSFVSKILDGFKWKTQIKFEHYLEIWQKAQVIQSITFEMNTQLIIYIYSIRMTPEIITRGHLQVRHSQ